MSERALAADAPKLEVFGFAQTELGSPSFGAGRGGRREATPDRRRRRLLWVTDIPTPYRVHLLSALARAADERDIDLSVRFMARSVRFRRWSIEPEQMRFEHRISRGLHLELRSGIVHFNPQIAASVLARPPDWLVVGGTWWMPTSVSSMAAGRARATKVIMHLEANKHAMTFHRGPVAALRKAILDRAHAYAVPGALAIETLRSLDVDPGKKLLLLPNLVDEVKFGREVDELRRGRRELRRAHGLEPTDLALLWPARLEERLKGILRFLDAVKELVTPEIKILLAGEGADRAPIERWVSEHLPRNVRLLGHRSERAMQELLAAADVALLPSIIDPNPLSLVEALWAGLPLLVSNRCGNCPEVVEPGSNGWSFDPGDESSARAAFRALGSTARAELPRMGLASRKLAEERFSTPTCVARFVDELGDLTGSSTLGASASEPLRANK